MSFRINTNTQAARSLTALNKTTDGIAARQMRLATGSRINSAADDSAGFTISNKLKATTRGQAQALSNIGDAKSMLTVAEGALGSTMDILQTMKEKAVQAGNSSMGVEERAAIQSQVDALGAEVSDILGTANFNGTKLFSDDASGTNLSFQVGDKSGDTFGAKVGRMSVGSLGIGSVATADAAAQAATATVSAVTDDGTGTAITTGGFTLGGAYTGTADKSVAFTKNGANLNYTDADGNAQSVAIADGFEGVTIGMDSNATDGDVFTIDFTAATDEVKAGDFTSALDLTTDTGVASALTKIDAAISSVNKTASGLGDVQNRLDFKSQNLETSMNNYDSARSRIQDADFAKEQMEVVKLQILQQTGSAMFAQANSSGQSVLSFF